MSMPLFNLPPNAAVLPSKQGQLINLSECIGSTSESATRQTSFGSYDPARLNLSPHQDMVENPMTVKEMKKLLNDEKATLVAYLYKKVETQDWHGVADAAMDIRDVEAQLVLLNQAESGCLQLS